MNPLFKWILVFAFAIAVLATLFPKSAEIKLANGETALVYANGTVYYRAGLGTFDHRTLWQAEDGTIMSTRPMIAYRTYLAVPLVATPAEVGIWHQAMAAIL